MIKLSCTCGATFEVNHMYYTEDRVDAEAWLHRHQDCVNMGVIATQQAINQAEKDSSRWASGFNLLPDGCEFIPTGDIRCKECSYIQATDNSPQHAVDCSFYGGN